MILLTLKPMLLNTRIITRLNKQECMPTGRQTTLKIEPLRKLKKPKWTYRQRMNKFLRNREPMIHLQFDKFNLNNIIQINNAQYIYIYFIDSPFLKYPMQKALSCFANQSVTNKITIVFLINVLIVVAFMSISLLIQYQKIKSSQQQIPNNFFSNYNEYSLKQVSHKTKNLIYSMLDYRASFLTSIVNSIISEVNLSRQEISQQNIQQKFLQAPNKQSCKFSRPNNTMFSCRLNLYTKFILEQGWVYHIKIPARRLNIIYQNINDENDIMAKSIAQNPDFQIRNIKQINNRFKSLSKDRILEISTFYQDYYGNSKQNLVAFYTKLTYGNYRVLIQLQTKGAFIKQSINRVIYTDKTNIIVLQLNNTVEKGYNLVASFKQLNPSINYTSLLPLGYKITQINSEQIYSFTSSFSSSFNLGSINYLNNQQLNQNFVMIVHSPSISDKMQQSVYGFISNLNRSLKQILGVFFVIFLIWMVVNTTLLTYKLSRILNQIRQLINKYTKQPEKYALIINQVNNKNLSDYLVGFILKAIIQIINLIEHNKKKFRKISKKLDNDQYPLNLFEKQFMSEQGIEDNERFEKLRVKIVENLQAKKQKKKRSDKFQ